VIEEFNRFIQAGDSEKTKQRLEQLDKTLAESGGYLGMGL
jgi:heme-degrading monooxygenase HmoA